MQVAFQTAEDLSLAVESVFREIPVLLYHKLDSVAPYPGFQSHDGIEMYYIERGEGLYLVGDRAYPLRPGTLIIIRPFTLHKVLQANSEGNICRSVLMWKEELLKADWPAHQPYPLEHMPENGCRVFFEPGLQERVRNIYHSLNEEWTGRKSGYLSVIACLIKELLLLAYRSCQSAEEEAAAIPQPQDLPREISYLVQYISGHFQNELALEQLGTLVHMNPSYLSALFHKHVGLTITRFIAVKRIHYAKKLLRETGMSVTDIAYQCGFNHPTYFNKTFKRLEQTSPASYRKERLPV